MAEWHEPVIDLSPEHYSAIGEFLQRWAQLEYQLQEIIWYGMGLNEKQGRTLTVGMKSLAICGALRTAMKFWILDKIDQADIHTLIDGVEDNVKERNQLAHGTWQAPPGSNGVAYLHYVKETRQRLMPEFKRSYGPADVKLTCAKLRDLNVLADAVVKRLRARWLASQGK